MCVYELLGPELLRKLYDKLGVLLTDTTHSHSSSWQVSVSFGLMINVKTFSTSRNSILMGWSYGMAYFSHPEI